jgi:hypothetical protein
MKEWIMELNNMLESVRQFRLGPFAAFDSLGTVLLMALATPLVNRFLARWDRKLWYSEMIALGLPLGFFFHVLFSVDTPFVKMFFTDGSYLPEIVLAALFIFGIKGLFSRRPKTSA